MRPEQDLPLPPAFTSTVSYVDELLDFVSSSQLLQLLTGGVHILDFFVREPDMYEWLIPPSWRAWFDLYEREHLLALFTADDVRSYAKKQYSTAQPPESLLAYISSIRRLSLRRSRTHVVAELPRDVALGMKIKKVHEVGQFARYIDRLTSDIASAKQEDITHLVDFGSGQNYLGRTLASRLYNRKVIAVESRHHNVERAKSIDVQAKIMPKTITWRNKKIWREAVRTAEENGEVPPLPFPQTQVFTPSPLSPSETDERRDSIQYVEHRLEDGDLSAIVPSNSSPANLLVMSLHSCGNLTHHGLRSLVLNPGVKVVAMVGCCYNLVTEVLTPPSYKLPSLRPSAASNNERISGDPHGYPMSSRVRNHPSSPAMAIARDGGTSLGIHLNITARMMAVQAPLNWTPSGSDSFFTRHFFRALLQRVFMDRRVVPPPQEEEGCGGATQPIIIGCLRKHCYTSFIAYVRGAISKLTRDPPPGLSKVAALEKMEGITDDEIQAYADGYAHRKKHLSIIWTLMAFSATLVEAVIVVDRWLWLKEQECVERAWVEPVWDYALSPRNLVIVGVKK